MLEPAENADAEPEMNLVPEVDARASSGCSSQKWMPCENKDWEIYQGMD